MDMPLWVFSYNTYPQSSFQKGGFGFFKISNFVKDK